MTNKTLVSMCSSLESDTVFFGPQGFLIADTEQKLDEAQLGFSKDDTGADLSGSNVGDWQPSWCVIARDTELGDPYFVDTRENEFPVYTAFLGESGWEAEPVSKSLTGFVKSMNLLYNNGKQTQAQFFPDESAITEQTQLDELLAQLCESSQLQSFWQLFFRCYQDWLVEE